MRHIGLMRRLVVYIYVGTVSHISINIIIK